uniref:Endonuclease/exonuclease/phosphatase n=1 Tax=Solanum tuberosum TaxID=4113 RepID=M1AYJ1_SOLTU
MFPGSPVGYWPAETLTKVASAVERPLHTDNVTGNADKISYARVLIEVDVSQPLIELVLLETPSGPWEHRWTMTGGQSTIMNVSNLGIQMMRIGTKRSRRQML